MKRTTVMAAVFAVLVAACTSGGTATTIPAPSTTATSAASTSSTTTLPPLETGVGVEEDTIHLAAFLPLSGSLSGIGASVLDGQRAYWRYVNEDLGGVGGEFRVELQEVDTAYDPVTATSEWTTRSGWILGISSVLGSPVTQALLDADSTAPIMVGSQASTWARYSNAVFDLAVPTYRDQVSMLWGQAVEAAGEPGEVGFVAPVGVYGDDCLAGTGSIPQIISRYPAGTTDFEEVVASLEGAKTFVACVTSADLVRIIATAQLLGFDVPFFATALSYEPSVLDALETVPGNLFVAGAPPPYEADVPGMTLFRTITGGLDDVNTWTFLGYTQAATFHLLLEQAISDGALTRAGVLLARSHLGGVDFGFGWGTARYDSDGVLPIVPVTVGVPDPDARFGLRPTPKP